MYQEVERSCGLVGFSAAPGGIKYDKTTDRGLLRVMSRSCWEKHVCMVLFACMYAFDVP